MHKSFHFDNKVWGDGNADELEKYSAWLHKHPHCSSPRPAGGDGPKPGQIKDEENPTLFYTSYERDKPKPYITSAYTTIYVFMYVMSRHNLYAKRLGNHGKVQEVCEFFEQREWERKASKRVDNKGLRWDDLSVNDYSKLYHLAERKCPPPDAINQDSIENIDSANTTFSTSKLSTLDELWPANAITLSKPPKINKISPWMPVQQHNQFTRYGTFLDDYKIQELNMKVDSALQLYFDSFARKRIHSGAAVEPAKLELLDDLSKSIADEIIVLNKRIADKNYLYDKMKATEIDISSFTGLDLDDACFRANVLAVKMYLLAGKSPKGIDQDDPLFNRVFEKALFMDTQAESLIDNQNDSTSRKNIQEILVTLFKYGADVNFISEASRCAPIHRAAICGNVKLFTWLLEIGARINLKSKKDFLTAAHYAARQGQVLVLAQLVKRMGKLDDVLATDHRGWNCLHICCSYGNLQTALFLLRIGIDKRILDSQNLTAGQVAQNAGFKRTGIEVMGYSDDDKHIPSLLNYITDRHHEAEEEETQRQNFIRHNHMNDDGASNADSSYSFRLMRMASGATSTMKHMMSYLYKSLHLPSEKFD